MEAPERPDDTPRRCWSASPPSRRRIASATAEFEAEAALNQVSGGTGVMPRLVREYTDFAAANWEKLVFGCTMLGLSSFGQTYFIALFGADFRMALGLSDGKLSVSYAAATFCSAATLPLLGSLLGRVGESTFAWASIAVLSAAMVVISLSVDLVTLTFGLYMARLGGQGLMVHAALTITSRALPLDSGKATAISLTGLAVAQAALPPLTVAVLHLLGWRWTWIFGLALLLAGGLIAMAHLPRHSGFDRVMPTGPVTEGGLASPGKRYCMDRASFRSFAVFFPVMLFESFTLSGLLFHQTTLAAEKGWPLDLWASSFVFYSMTQVATMLLAGPSVDRVGAARLLPIFLAPQVAALILLGSFSGFWLVPLFFVLSAISGGLDSSLQTPALAQLFGINNLARTRAFFEGGRVMVTGLGPAMLGLALDQGLSMSQVALALALVAVISILVAIAAPQGTR